MLIFRVILFSLAYIHSSVDFTKVTFQYFTIKIFVLLACDWLKHCIISSWYTFSELCVRFVWTISDIYVEFSNRGVMVFIQSNLSMLHSFHSLQSSFKIKINKNLKALYFTKWSQSWGAFRVKPNRINLFS